MTRRTVLRLLSWNVAKRRAYRDQIEAISNVDPDVIALQEVSYRRSDALIEALSDLGYSEARYSWDLTLAPAFKHGVLVASRWPLAAKVGPDVPYPESALSVEAASPYGPIEVTTVHVPNGSTYGVKGGRLRALRRGWHEVPAALR